MLSSENARFFFWGSKFWLWTSKGSWKLIVLCNITPLSLQSSPSPLLHYLESGKGAHIAPCWLTCSRVVTSPNLLSSFNHLLLALCPLQPPAGCWSQETAVGAACRRGCNLFQWSFLKACVWLIVFMCVCVCVAPYALVGCVLGSLCPQLASMLFMLCSRWLEYWLPRGLPAAPTLPFLSTARMKCEFCFGIENAQWDQKKRFHQNLVQI